MKSLKKCTIRCKKRPRIFLVEKMKQGFSPGKNRLSRDPFLLFEMFLCIMELFCNFFKTPICSVSPSSSKRSSVITSNPSVNAGKRQCLLFSLKYFIFCYFKNKISLIFIFFFCFNFFPCLFYFYLLIFYLPFSFSSFYFLLL